MSNSAARLWTRNFILVSAINFQLVLIFYLLVVVIVGYAVTELNATTANAGLVSGLFIVGTLIGRLIVGQFLDKLGRKKTLIMGLSGFLIFSILYFLPLNLEMLLLIRFSHGFMMGIASSVLGTIIAQILPAPRRGEGIGYYSMSSTLGTAIGPFLAIWMMFNLSYDAIFLLSTAISINCLIVAFFINISHISLTQKQHLNPTQQPLKPTFISRFIEPKALPISIIILFTSICYSGVLSFINLYAKEIDLVPAASFFFLMYAIAILVSRPFTGPLMDKRGENIIIYPAFILMGCALILLSFAQTSSIFLLCAGLLGFGYGNIQSVCQTIAVKSASLERMGFATSTFYIFLDAGLGFGPYFLGIALNYINYAQLYLYSGISAFICIIFYFLLHDQKQH
ncbi:MFS transporter [Acinetobacter sp. ANC 4558]|uniref:MFS transporter n=1 Tax=Acinetobacter sp. ANC 4558 TaxID=1977876 RepID=UPI000A33B1C8|nr:MFS transporter [Acinetobacter sp. ANC 4558]OTG87124.1 MFS transporter [Acinetobacter sp. ANC 4558]